MKISIMSAIPYIFEAKILTHYSLMDIE